MATFKSQIPVILSKAYTLTDEQFKVALIKTLDRIKEISEEMRIQLQNSENLCDIDIHKLDETSSIFNTYRYEASILYGLISNRVIGKSNTKLDPNPEPKLHLHN